MGAHTLGKHVGKSDEWLRLRLAAEPGQRNVSTYFSEEVAAATIGRLLAANASKIAAWLSKPTEKWLPLVGRMQDDVGRIMNQSGSVNYSNGARVVIAQDSTMPGGYRIMTSFVIP